MSEHAINGFVGISMEKIRNFVDTNTMMGDPINCKDGTTVIPISKISVGFGSGGSDLPTRTAKEYFAGGAGGGISIKPVGFLVAKDGDVKLVQLTMNADKANVLLDMVPGLVDKVISLIPKKGDKAEKSAEVADEAVETIEEA